MTPSLKPIYSNNKICNKPTSLCLCNLPDVSQTEPVSNIVPGIVLPYLNHEDKMILATGEMIEKKYINGSTGFGLVVVDIHCSADMVFETLTQFDMYQEMIPMIRSSKIISSDGVNIETEFTLRYFLLHINIKYTVLKHKRLIQFILDTTRVNLLLRETAGFWHVEIPADRPEGYCRVYLSANILTHNNVPKSIVDYASTKALSRATTWMKPFFIEKLAKEDD